MEVIRIPVPVSLHGDQDSNPCSTDSNLDFQKGLNSCSMRVIRILIQQIQIPIQRIRILIQRIRIQIPVKGTLMN